MIDTADLARRAVEILAPVLPVLVKGAAEESGKQLTRSALDVASRLWERVRVVFASRPHAADVARELAENPEDLDLQAALRVQLRKTFDEDPVLARDLGEMLDSISGQRNVVVASGVGTVGVGGNVIGSTISTGSREN